jgi:hypothetical protein
MWIEWGFSIIGGQMQYDETITDCIKRLVTREALGWIGDINT